VILVDGVSMASRGNATNLSVSQLNMGLEALRRADVKPGAKGLGHRVAKVPGGAVARDDMTRASASTETDLTCENAS